jgi:hypothetical protein
VLSSEFPSRRAIILHWGRFAQTAEPEALTLACEGTRTNQTEGDTKPKVTSLSLGVVVNFADRTVKGFGVPTDEVKVNNVTETYIAFGGGPREAKRWSIRGKIDRVTGDLSAIRTSMLRAQPPDLGRARRIDADASGPEGGWDGYRVRLR